MREQVIEQILDSKIIAIIRGVDSKKLIKVAQAMYDGGIRLLEITYSANGSVSDEETANNIKLLSEHFKGKMFIGAGTVLTTKQVKLTKKAGGQFIISPDVNVAVIKKTRKLKMVSLPGALTPTEIQTAHNAGADMIKLFPITNMGPDYVKAIKAPLSHVKMLAVGGVNLNNMADYLSVGINGFGLGSNITPKKHIDEENYPEITALAKQYVDACK
ncbi:MAG: bifunctional 4-hydroxy-2-oxoglutarate aldolase/2-dehydro-3-deoxy-phosphogluconate aldolase [Clostridia bacterium]|nr:bifunctional 4-hydroxy-2-oxoglutarate aldolase/2-dehydro-3-deoxy-phosphogluconate aldolase [Clostridia bacterium]